LEQIRERLRHFFSRRPQPGSRILIVRGSRMADEMARILHHYRLNIELVERAALLDYARRTHPDLIVSDLSVSGMSEMEDALRLRQFLPACKVMLFSGQGLRRATLPRESELELVRALERLCSDPLCGQMLWLDLARFIQTVPRHRSMAA
jgi:CheY-like chemotaxis protein